MAITKLRSKLIKSTTSQYIIAAGIGIHPSTLSAYALGKKPIKNHHLIQICEYFNCDAADILGMTDELDIIEIGA